MKFAHLIGCLCLALPLVGCDDSGASAYAGDGSESSKPDPTPPPPPAPAVKDTKDLLKLAVARWEMIEAADWIQAYEFLSPARQRQQSLGQYLQGKDDHEYRNPSKPILLGEEEDQAYLELSVLWTPHHAILGTAKNKPDDYTQTLNVIETWQWIDGKWYWIQLERQNEFLDEHPKFK